MKKMWKKEARMCASCHDKPAISHRHGYDRDKAIPFDDLCPRCARDYENRIMARAMSGAARVIELRLERPAAMQVAA